MLIELWPYVWRMTGMHRTVDMILFARYAVAGSGRGPSVGRSATFRVLLLFSLKNRYYRFG
jgi:hypothetical protein